MKDTIKDRLIHLAVAQEFMTDVTDKMADWDKSQSVMEQSAFDSLNVSDDVLRLSREGSELIDNLSECCLALVKNPGVTEQKELSEVLAEIHNIFNKINEASARISIISHQIEGQAAIQKKLEEGVKQSLEQLGGSIDTVAACAEFIMADF